MIDDRQYNSSVLATAASRETSSLFRFDRQSAEIAASKGTAENQACAWIVNQERSGSGLGYRVLAVGFGALLARLLF